MFVLSIAGLTVPSNDPVHAGVVVSDESELGLESVISVNSMTIAAYLVLGMPAAKLKSMNGEYTPLIAGKKEFVTP
jgi:hypothetical protein